MRPSTGPYLNGDPTDIIPDEQLPFTRFKLPPEEEDPDSIQTGTKYNSISPCLSLKIVSQCLGR